MSIDQSRIGLRGPSLRAASLPARVVSIDQSRIGLRGAKAESRNETLVKCPSIRAASACAAVRLEGWDSRLTVSIDQSRIGLRGGRTRKSCESKRL